MSGEARGYLRTGGWAAEVEGESGGGERGVAGEWRVSGEMHRGGRKMYRVGEAWSW